MRVLILGGDGEEGGGSDKMQSTSHDEIKMGTETQLYVSCNLMIVFPW